MNDTTNNPKGLFRCASEIALKVLEISKRWKNAEGVADVAQAAVQAPTDLQALRDLQVVLVHRRQTDLVGRLRVALNSFIRDLVEADDTAAAPVAPAAPEAPVQADGPSPGSDLRIHSAQDVSEYREDGRVWAATVDGFPVASIESDVRNTARLLDAPEEFRTVAYNVQFAGVLEDQEDVYVEVRKGERAGSALARARRIVRKAWEAYQAEATRFLDPDLEDLDLVDQNAPLLPNGAQVADAVQAVRDATTDREALEAVCALVDSLPETPKTAVQLGSVRAANRMLQAAQDAFPVRRVSKLRVGDVFFVVGCPRRVETVLVDQLDVVRTDHRTLSGGSISVRVVEFASDPDGTDSPTGRAPSAPALQALPPRTETGRAVKAAFAREGARVGIPALPALTPGHVRIYDAETGVPLEFEVSEVEFDGGRVGIGLKGLDALAPVRAALAIINLDSEDPFDRRFQAAAALRAATSGPGDVVAVCARVADSLETEGGRTTWDVLNSAETALQGLL